jgi:UPF0271 protein
MAARDRPLADALARAVAAFDRSLRLFAPPQSEMVIAARAVGIPVAIEVFADRAYEPDGRLASRQKSGAVLHDVDLVVARAVSLVKDRAVLAIDGSRLVVDADTMCIHGDTPGADRLAAAIRNALQTAGIAVEAIGAP